MKIVLHSYGQYLYMFLNTYMSENPLHFIYKILTWALRYMQSIKHHESNAHNRHFIETQKKYQFIFHNDY